MEAYSPQFHPANWNFNFLRPVRKSDRRANDYNIGRKGKGNMSLGPLSCGLYKTLASGLATSEQLGVLVPPVVHGQYRLWHCLARQCADFIAQIF